MQKQTVWLERQYKLSQGWPQTEQRQASLKTLNFSPHTYLSAQNTKPCTVSSGQEAKWCVVNEEKLTSKLENKHTLIALWPVGIVSIIPNTPDMHFCLCILSALLCGLRKAPGILYDSLFQRQTELIPVIGDVSMMWTVVRS